MKASYPQYIEYLFARSHGAGVPLSGSFELTARCNLDCKMCYIHKRANDKKVLREELSAKQWLSFAADAQKQGMLLLLLTGGEPFLRPDFREIYTGCRKLGLLISINSNGTMITDDMVEFLRRDPPLRVNITLYGSSPETYEKLCGDPSAYERAFHAVLALKEAGIPVKLNYSATPYNIDDLPEIYAFARKHDLLIQTATYMFPPLRACENCECTTAERLSPRESARARFAYEEYRWSDNPEMFRRRMETLLAGGIPEDSDSECQELPTERIRCRAGDTTFWITYKGEMRPCGMMTVPTENTLECGFDEAWARTRESRQSIMIPAKCTSCEMRNACEVCPAGCWAENGEFTKAPQYLCDRTREYLRIAQEWMTKKNEEEQNEGE